MSLLTKNWIFSSPRGPQSNSRSALDSRLHFHIMEDKKPKEAPGHAEPKDNGNTDTPSPEDQMSAYEEELKNTDWGHQPC